METRSSGPQAATLLSAWIVAWPASLAAIISPLLGLIDTAVLARGADTQVLAGASLAGAVLAILYWTFGFLRMSLSGLAAQALGSGDDSRLRAHLIQGVFFGAAIGIALLALSHPIGLAAQTVMIDGTSASVGAGEAMRDYIRVRIIGAPAVLATVAILGWLSGQARTTLLLLITTVTALTNAGLSILFVLNFGWGIEGLAAATVIAEVTGLALAVASVAWVLRGHGGWLRADDVRAARQGLTSVLGLNRDIFLRTLILTTVISSFTWLGADFGDLTLAANHVLLNLLLTATLLLDGAAIAAETFVGQALGAPSDRKRLFRAAWQKTSIIAGSMAMALTLSLALFGQTILSATIGDGPGNQELLSEALRYLPWAAISPLAVGIAFQLDGVFIGATRGPALRNGMAAASILYIASALGLMPIWQNHGLWFAFLLFMVARGLGLILLWRGFEPLLADPQRA